VAHLEQELVCASKKDGHRLSIKAVMQFIFKIRIL